MLSEMTSIQILEWAVHFNEEPWGHDVENWRIGTVASIIANLFGRAKEDPAFTWKDFFGGAESSEPQSWQAQKAMATVLQAVFGGRIRTKDNGATGTGSSNSARG